LETQSQANLQTLAWTGAELEAYNIAGNGNNPNRVVDVMGKAPLSTQWYRNAHNAGAWAKKKVMIGFGIYRP
jgi:hypothetical protein